MAITSLIVANRGEIAIRIARAAADLGLEAVAVYSEDDAPSLHRYQADRAHPLTGVGPGAYLDIDAIVAAATELGCDAVHPGYGFLAENGELARRCEAAGLTFVGPTVNNLELFGDKGRARQAAIDADVPVLAGTQTPVTVGEAEAFLAELGAGGAVMIKAVAGGGGRGTRAVDGPAEAAATFERCRREAELAFGDGSLYVEELIPRARHVEVQIVGDGADHRFAFRPRAERSHHPSGPGAAGVPHRRRRHQHRLPPRRPRPSRAGGGTGPHPIRRRPRRRPCRTEPGPGPAPRRHHPGGRRRAGGGPGGRRGSGAGRRPSRRQRSAVVVRPRTDDQGSVVGHQRDPRHRRWQRDHGPGHAKRCGCRDPGPHSGNGGGRARGRGRRGGGGGGPGGPRGHEDGACRHRPRDRCGAPRQRLAGGGDAPGLPPGVRGGGRGQHRRRRRRRSRRSRPHPGRSGRAVPAQGVHPRRETARCGGPARPFSTRWWPRATSGPGP